MVTLSILVFAGLLMMGMTTLETRAEPTEATPRRKIGLWNGLMYLVLVGSLAGLGLTGLGTMFTFQSPMSRWILMAHCSVGPAFAVSVAFLALGMADRCRQSVVFWVMLASSLVVIVSAVLPMTPIPSQEGQHLLYQIHRISSIVVAVAAVLHVMGLPLRK